jgi:hypothetical protein
MSQFPPPTPPEQFPPPPASPLGYVTPSAESQYAPTGRRANGMGIASLVLGLVAMLFAWVPLCGLVPALLFGVVGGILGVVGLIAALSDKRTGIGFPLAGLIVCVAAPVLNVVLFMLLAWSGNRSQAQLARAQQAQAAAAALAQARVAQTPASSTPATAAAGLWVPADRHAVLGDLEVWVERARVRDVAVEATGGAAASSGRRLLIDLRVKNNSPTRTRACRTWAGAGGGYATGRDFGTLADDLGNDYRRITAGYGARVRGSDAAAALRPGATWSDVLVFEPPVGGKPEEQSP